jgi:hypothetical protein
LKGRGAGAEVGRGRDGTSTQLTTGALGMVLALNHCASVDAYGMHEPADAKEVVEPGCVCGSVGGAVSHPLQRWAGIVVPPQLRTNCPPSLTSAVTGALRSFSFGMALIIFSGLSHTLKYFMVANTNGLFYDV